MLVHNLDGGTLPGAPLPKVVQPTVYPHVQRAVLALFKVALFRI